MEATKMKTPNNQEKEKPKQLQPESESESESVSLLTTNEAARYLNVHPDTLRKMVRDGHINPYRTPGGRFRFTQEMLQLYLENSTEFRFPSREIRA